VKVCDERALVRIGGALVTSSAKSFLGESTTEWKSMSDRGRVNVMQGIRASVMPADKRVQEEDRF
jgi:hypothetical protein